MSLLKSLKTSDDVVVDKDRIGGGGFLLDNGLHELTIEHAYITYSDKKAMAMNVKFVAEDGKTLRYQEYITSNEEKGCKNTYIGKDKKEHYLPGFSKVNNLAMLTTGVPLNELDTEEKLIKIYNADAGGEAPTKVPCITEMFGQKVLAGVLRIIEDKMTKESGYKEPSGETREVNVIDKFFHAETRQLVAEALAGEEAVFVENWAKEYEGKPVINKAKGAGTAGAPAKGGAPGTGAAGAKKAAPLFSKK